ncbi:CLUMA_CG008345, isoform A [Clunio marinus]|uniref:CLUMA_CG008345, isoform A n=1 Tax=Clunio marinus TaxID=568069 RepID=A0A1J1I3I3_9DIPT|nr:CLUMA_CG008345, isoform A [Clunio marinus]
MQSLFRHNLGHMTSSTVMSKFRCKKDMFADKLQGLPNGCCFGMRRNEKEVLMFLRRFLHPRSNIYNSFTEQDEISQCKLQTNYLHMHLHVDYDNKQKTLPGVRGSINFIYIQIELINSPKIFLDILFNLHYVNKSTQSDGIKNSL